MITFPCKLDVKVFYDFCLALFIIVCIYLGLLFWAAEGEYFQ